MIIPMIVVSVAGPTSIGNARGQIDISTRMVLSADPAAPEELLEYKSPQAATPSSIPPPILKAGMEMPTDASSAFPHKAKATPKQSPKRHILSAVAFLSEFV
jgi:hypothetical protein